MVTKEMTSPSTKPHVRNYSLIVFRTECVLTMHFSNLYGTRSNYTCRATHGANGCDIYEIPCGEVYTVVVAPLTQEGVKGHILPQKTLLGYKMILFYLYLIF